MTTYWCEYAWLGACEGDTVRSGVVIEIADGYIATLRDGVATPPPGATRLAGLTLPGLANTHSHAFHRALRGGTGRGASFWAWREQMYAVAARLNPQTSYALARATYAEMALAGITCVGEFHYVHHGPGGTPYADEHAMANALVAAAAEAGVRITLLDTCYLSGGLTTDGSQLPLQGTQLRFGDNDAQAWAARVDRFRPEGEHARTGAALHSVRAVPPAQLGTVADWARDRQAPLHAHLGEQPHEHAACRAAYDATPTELLTAAGALERNSTLVHATHLDGTDLARISDGDPSICLCPTTERDLGDGVAATPHLRDAGRLCLGTDGQTWIDLFEEARLVELHERLVRGHRGTFAAAELLSFATAGHEALGWPHAGRLSPGARADLVTVRLDEVALAGWEPTSLLEWATYAATARDVYHVVVDGRVVVAGGQHRLVEDVPGQLGAAVAALAGR